MGRINGRGLVRKVEVTNIIEGPDKNSVEVCDFHMFTGGYMSGTVAIVEHSDGRISEIPVRLIRFVEAKKKEVSTKPFTTPNEIDFKFVSSEIVRGMTNAGLSVLQKEELQNVGEIVISNHLIHTDKGYKRG